MAFYRTINGRVTDAYGNPHVDEDHFVGVVARFVDGSETLLAQAQLVSEAAASYSLTIALPEQLDQIRADLVGVELRVYTEAAHYYGTSPLGRSALVVAPQAVETIDVVIGQAGAQLRGPSEVKRLAELLAAVGVAPPSTLSTVNTHEKMSLLAARTGIDPRTLVLYRRAADIAAELGFAPNTQQDTIFALGRQKLPLSVLGLALAGEATIDDALVQAVEANVIEAIEGEPPSSVALVAALDSWLRGDAASHVEALRDLVGLSCDPEVIVGLYLAAADVDAFWEAFVHEFGQSDADIFRLVTRLAVLTRRHDDLVGDLMASRGEVWNTVEDLAAWDADQWGNVTSNVPPDYDGSLGAYCAELEVHFEEQLPTASALLRLAAEAEPLTGMEEIAAYYRSHLDFDLDVDAAREYAADHPELSGSALDVLAAIQRIYRIAPELQRSKAIRALINAGYGSAHAIAAVTPQTFKAALSELLDTGAEDGEARALVVHKKASQMKGLTDALVARHSAAFDTTPMRAVGSVEIVESVGDILGIGEAVGCPHDRSIFGPAAYLADLMAFVEAKPSLDPSYDRLLDRLAARRPDLGQTKLGTDNTLVTLPAIDLANEVLEARYAAETGLATPGFARNTTGTSEERRAIPEHRIAEVYGGASAAKELRERRDHLAFPFDRDKARFREALQLLDFDPATVFEALATTPAEQSVADRERLGIVSEVDCVDIETPNTVDVLTRWGAASLTELSKVAKLLQLTELSFEELQQAVESPTFGKTIVYPGKFGDVDTATVNPIFSAAEADLLRRALKLQRRSGWSFREIERAIALMPVPAVGWQNVAGVEVVSNNLTKTGAAGWDAGASTGGMVDGDGYVEFGTVEGNLRFMVGLNVDDTTRGYGDIDFALYPASDGHLHVYENGAHLGPFGAYRSTDRFRVEVANNVVTYQQNGVVIYTSTATPASSLRVDTAFYDPGATAIDIVVRGSGFPAAMPIAAMGMTESVHRRRGIDRETLLNWASGEALDTTAWGREPSFQDRMFPQGLPDLATAPQQEIAAALTITPAKLQAIGGATTAGEFAAAFRTVGMARALGMDVQTFYELKETLEIPIVDASSLTSAFARIAELRDLRISAAEAQHLFDSSSLLDGQVSEADYLAALQSTLEPFWSPDSEISASRTQLSRTALEGSGRPDAIVSANRLVAGCKVTFKAAETQAAKVVGLATEAGPFLTEALLVAFSLHAGGTFELLEQGRSIATGSYTTDDAFSLEVAQGQIVCKQGDTTVASSATSVSPAPVAVILEAIGSAVSDVTFTGPVQQPNRQKVGAALVTYGGGVSVAVAEAIAAGVEVTGGGGLSLLTTLIEDLFETGTNSNRQNALGIFQRYALLVTRLKLALSDVPWLLSYGSAAMVLGTGDATTKAAVRELFEAGAIKKRLRADELYEGLLGESNETFIERFCERVDDAPLPLVTQLVEDVFGAPVSVAELRTLERAISVLEPSGMLPESFGSLFAPIGDGHASSMLEVARKGRSDAAWFELIQPVNDRLRRAQRDALTRACLLEGVAETKEALYSELLIDTEMQPCQQTSRIKSAIGSVQQFINRIFLRLEGPEQMSDDDAQLWEWMRSYRVWEANRKVFVYPENWLEPEWRDDKTPFFRELEDELAQGEITEERVEELVIGYLEKVHDVSHLEIAAICAAGATMHVVARTKRDPRRYYYRHRESEAWSAWESLDVEVEGEQMMLMPHNRRLYLLWPSFSETTPAARPDDDKAKSPVKNHAIHLSWCERKHGRWSPPRRSQAAVSLENWGTLRGNGPSAAISMFFAKLGEEEQGDFTFLVTSDDGTGDLLVEPLRLKATQQISEVRRTFMRALRFRIHAATNKVTVELPGSEDWTCPVLPGFDREGQQIVGQRSRLILARRQPSVEAHSGVTVLDSVAPGYRVMCPASAIVPTLDTLPLVFEDGDRVYIIDQKLPAMVQLADPGLDVGSHATSVWKSSASAAIASGIDAFGLDVETSVVNTGDSRMVVAHQDLIAKPMPLLGLLALPQREQEAALGNNIAFTAGEVMPPPTNRMATITGMSLVSGGMSSLLLRSGGAPPAGSHTVTIDGTAVPVPTYEQFGAIPMPDFLNAQPNPGLDFRGPSDICRTDEYRFTRMHYPHAEQLLTEINLGGLWAVYRPAPDSPLHRQNLSTGFYFSAAYQPKNVVNEPYETPDFRPHSPMGVYNWEIFFHMPLLLAKKLRQHGEYAAARKWLHAIFDPTHGGIEFAPIRYWRFRPFYQIAKNDGSSQSIDELLALVAPDEARSEGKLQTRRDVLAQIKQWSHDPFSPHAIARLRVRSYQPAVVMAYLDVLIEWGDALFRRDSMESINEATQLYMLAAELLGPVPVEVPGRERPESTYEELDPFGGGFSNAIVEVENKVIEVPVTGDEPPRHTGPAALGVNAIEQDSYLYFGVPHNQRLVDLYWGRIADRLFKIHHCQNIDGIERALALFEPPIDPALLIRAKALGISIGDVLLGLDQALPAYRFEATLALARNMCRDVQQLETELLAALEKRDVEELSRLRSNHEIEINQMIERIRRQAVDEARQQQAVVKRRREAAWASQLHFESLPFRIAEEQSQLSLLEVADGFHLGAAVTRLVGQGVRIVNAPRVGTAGIGPYSVFRSPTEVMSLFLDGAAMIFEGYAGTMERGAHRAGITAAQKWRKTDSDYRAASAARDVATLDAELVAAEIRLAMARYELERHRKVVEHSKEMRDFVTDKFSSFELYDWMVGELTRLHKDAYDMALDLSRKAQKCLQFDLGEPGLSFVRPLLATSLRDRLFAGDELAADLRKMEAYHFERNTRKHELTRHISLAEIAPSALLELRATGACDFELLEGLFDLDVPGHYLRRIKSVALSIPSTAGPYTPLHAKLGLQQSRVRIDPRATKYQDYIDGKTDQRSVTSLIPRTTSMVTSGGVMDAGLFEANLNDPRYLPFEGAGAVSSWSLELPPPTIAGFDYQSISDVIVHLRYSAMPGGQRLSDIITDKIATTLEEVATLGGTGDGAVMVDLSASFPTEWQAFISGGEGAELVIPMDAGFFPFQLRKETITLTSLRFVQAGDGTWTPAVYYGATSIQAGSPTAPDIFVSAPLSLSVDLASLGAADELKLSVSQDPAAMKGLTVIIGYSLS